MQENSQKVNSAHNASTSDGIARPNGMTREQWLYAVLYSGRVSRIGQHLALVIYHLADTTTNIAKLSARDLERITGWSRTAIIEHLNELHKLGEFLRVTWGQGRAKSIFELQGVIAEVMAQKKAEREAATTVATTADATSSGNVPDATAATKPDTTSYVSEPATEVATTVAATPSVSVADTKTDRCVSVADTTSEKTAEGGTIGGETTSRYKDLSHSLSAREARSWMVSEDGGFEGIAFELSGVDVGALQTTYSNLEFPAELVAADRFLASQFDKAGVVVPTADRLARLHQYLAKLNRTAREMRLSLEIAAATKGRRKPSEPIMPATPAEPPSCWMDGAGLHLMNGARTDWLQKFDNDEGRLDLALKEIAPYVKPNSPTPLLVQVNGKLAKIVGEKLDKDTRYAKAAKPEKGISRLKEKFLRHVGVDEQ